MLTKWYFTMSSESIIFLEIDNFHEIWSRYQNTLSYLPLLKGEWFMRLFYNLKTLVVVTRHNIAVKTMSKKGIHKFYTSKIHKICGFSKPPYNVYAVHSRCKACLQTPNFQFLDIWSHHRKNLGPCLKWNFSKIAFLRFSCVYMICHLGNICWPDVAQNNMVEKYNVSAFKRALKHPHSFLRSEYRCSQIFNIFGFSFQINVSIC